MISVALTWVLRSTLKQRFSCSILAVILAYTKSFVETWLHIKASQPNKSAKTLYIWCSKASIDKLRGAL